MQLLLILFLINFLIFLFAVFIKQLVYHLIKKNLQKVFDGYVHFDGDTKTFFSLRNLQCANSTLDRIVNCLYLSFKIYVYGGIFTEQSRIIEIEISNFTLNLINQSTDNNFDFALKIIQENKRKKLNQSLEDWIKQRIGIFFLTLFVRKSKIRLNNVKITYNNTELFLKKLHVDFERSRKKIKLSLNIGGLYIFKENKLLLSIPSFLINGISTNQIARLILSNRLSDLIIQSHDGLNLNFEHGCFYFAEINLLINDKENEKIVADDVNLHVSILQSCKISISNFQIKLPVYDLFTEKASLSINNILYKNNIISTGTINAFRNDIKIADINGILFKGRHLRIEGCAKIHISATLLIDIGLILRYIFGTVDIKPASMDVYQEYKNNLTKFTSKQSKIGTNSDKDENQSNKSNPNSSDDNFQTKKQAQEYTNLFSRFVVEAKNVEVKFSLSDTHTFLIFGSDLHFQDYCVSGKKCSAFIDFKDMLFNLAKANNFSLMFKKPLFVMKMDELNVYLDNNFAEGNFLLELFGIISWFDTQFRGKVAYGSSRGKGPPLRRLFIIDAKKATCEMINKHLACAIALANEAKRSAMESLQLMQSKAIEIIKASSLANQNIQSHYGSSDNLNGVNRENSKINLANYTFDPDAFDKASKKILFDYFCSSLSEIKNTTKAQRSYSNSKKSKKNGNEKEKIVQDSDNEDLPMLTGSCKNFHFSIDGLAIKNKKASIKLLKELEPKLRRSKFGKISGGFFDLEMTDFSVSLPHVEKIMEISNSHASGFFFGTKPKLKKQKDLYHIIASNDNGYDIMNIPMISSKSVSFIKAKVESSSFKILFTPVVLEVFQDNKLNTTLYRKTNLMFLKPSFIDNLRLRFKFFVDWDIDQFHFQYNDATRAYESNPFIDVCLNNSKMIIDGTKIHLNAQTLDANLCPTNSSFLSHEYERFARFYEPNIFIDVPSSNPKNPSGKLPVFIPIDSTRIKDENYDPFKKYRTSSYYGYIKITFNNNRYSTITLTDQCIQTFIDQFMTPKQLISIFNAPARFVKPFYPTIVYAFTEIIVDIPPLSINLFDKSLNLIMKISGNSKPTFAFISHKQNADKSLPTSSQLSPLLYFSFHNRKLIPTITVAAETLIFSILIDSGEIGYLSWKGFLFSKIGTENRIIINSIIGNIFENRDLSIFMNKLMKVNVKVPTAPPKEKIIENKVFQNIDEFRKQFKTIALSCSIETINIDIQPITQIKLTTKMKNLSYETAVTNDIKSASLNTLRIDQFHLEYNSINQLLDLDKFEIDFAIASNLTVIYASLNCISLMFRPADIENFMPIYDEIKGSFPIFSVNGTIRNQKDPLQIEQNKKQKGIIFLGGSFYKVNPILIYHNRPFVVGEIIHTEFTYKIFPDGTENITIIINSLTIEHPKYSKSKSLNKLNEAKKSKASPVQSSKQDEIGLSDSPSSKSNAEIFRKMFEVSNTNDNPFLTVKMDKLQPMMKCPVFERISFSIEPFTIRIPIPLIKKLISIFPTADTLKMLTLEPDPELLSTIDGLPEDDSIQNANEDYEIEKLNKDTISKSDENAIFLRELIVSPFNAEINIRWKTKGAFKDFLNRPFYYRGLHFYDVFGNKDKLTMLVKKNIWWSLVKALPGLVFRKKRRETTTTQDKKTKKTLPIELGQKE